MRSFTVSTKRVRQILPKIKPRCSLLNQNLLYTFSYDKTTHSRRLAISPTRRQCDSWRTATVVKYAFEHTRISCSPVRFGVFLCCSRSQSLVSTLLFFQKHLNSTATNSIFIIENWNATVFWAKRKSDRENIQAETQRRTDDVADVNSCWFAEKKKNRIEREKKLLYQQVARSHTACEIGLWKADEKGNMKILRVKTSVTSENDFSSNDWGFCGRASTISRPQNYFILALLVRVEPIVSINVSTIELLFQFRTTLLSKWKQNSFAEERKEHRCHVERVCQLTISAMSSQRHYR